jgi:DNA-binding HxlR family transcriptional regulator
MVRPRLGNTSVLDGRGESEMGHGEFGRKPRRQWAPDARALSIVGDRWLMVIVRDLAAGPLRLEALRRWLPGVSAGALEARLARMAEEGLLDRRRRRSLPPRVDLELTERGHALANVIAELARWELRGQWSRPREDEWIDVGACFRLAPFLQPPEASGAPAVDGELALTILSPDEEPEHYAFVRERGRTKIEHREAPDADAQLAGTQDAWVAALSPNGTAAKLQATGDQALADSFLKLFTSQDRA